MSVLANEIFLTVAGILVGSVDAQVFSDVSFTEDAKGRALILSNRLYRTNFMKNSIPALVYIIIYTRPC